jgi:hypothetical protein
MVRRVSMTAFVASYVAALLAFASAGVTAWPVELPCWTPWAVR